MNLLHDAFLWLSDASHWSGPDSIPLRAGQHLALTAVVLVAASLIAVPASVLVGHTRRGQLVTVALAGAARAIPTLGLLTLLGLIVGIGARAPILALVVLAVPSLLAGCAAGVRGVDPTTVDAARATGLTELQLVRQVELPLAAPVIVGALRAATLQVVATATLAAYVADLGLGRYLFTGLKSRDYGQMLGGAVIVATLALVLELALAALHRASARRTQPVEPAQPARESRRHPRFPTTEGHR
ncbi:ABC transporter permease (plasmid) [Cellulomonas sp. WB94]|uniref:ABC transporter permease n=1 Tax=Cellulomonas sp. WB94 TaxID=2173174 RepID=UPI000D57543B|nr:ABC transporter permease [Cellulomonas sp. WB94]PVU84476.1 ABC transporter permease [Cellulomonas sp. WB94]